MFYIFGLYAVFICIGLKLKNFLYHMDIIYCKNNIYYTNNLYTSISILLDKTINYYTYHYYFFRKFIFCLNSWTIAWYLLIGCHIFLVIKQSDRYNNKFNSAVCSMIILLMLRLSLLLRPHNILVPGVLVYTCKLLQFKSWNTLTITILHYWLSLMFFFYQVNHL